MRAFPLFLAALLPSVVHAQDSARDIVARVERLLRGNSSQGTVTIEVVTADRSRSLDLEIGSLGTGYSLLRVLTPRKDAGMATLESGSQSSDDSAGPRIPKGPDSSCSNHRPAALDSTLRRRSTWSDWERPVQ